MHLHTRARLLLAAALITGAGVSAAIGVPRVLSAVTEELRTEDDAMQEIASAAVWAADRRTAAKAQSAIQQVAQRHRGIVAAEMMLSNGRTLLRFGQTARLRRTMAADSLGVRRIALMQNGRPWGEVRVLFEPLVHSSVFHPRNPMFWALVGSAILVLPIASTALQSIRRRLDRSPGGPIAVAADRARHTLDTLAECVLLLDAESRILFANHTMAETLGIAERSLLGRSIAELRWTEAPGGSPVSAPPWDTAALKGEPQRGVRIGLQCGNSARVFIANCTPLFKRRNRLHGLLVTLDDVTELEENRVELQRARDSAQHANEAKSRFLAMMSHEIRTPLNGVFGSLQLLKKTPLSERQPRYLDAAQFSASTLLHLINDILDFSKIEAGQLELSPIDFDLERCIDETMLMMVPNAVNKGLDLAYEIAPGVGVGVRGDPDRIRQIVINLLNNAVKFTQRGSVCLRIGPERQTDDRQLLRCEVSDTGVGIPSDKMHRLFKAFSQVDSSTSRRYGGTGLGLVISRQLCEMMGGGIQVASEEGKGTTFTFTLDLPRAAVPDSDPIKAPSAPTLCIAAGLHECEIATLQHALDLDDAHLVAYPDHAAIVGAGHEIRQRVGAASALVVIGGRRVEDISLAATRVREIVPRVRIVGASYSDEQAGPGAGPGAGPAVDLWIRRPIGAKRFVQLVSGTDAAEKSAGASSGSDANGYDLSGLRVLLAEDNAVGRMVVADMLRSAGVRCDTAEDGGSTLAAVQKQRYDLILMDCFMPDMDGFEATKKVRELQRSGVLPPSLPVIALTAKAMRGDREACLEAGMDGYISKPVDENELLATIAAHTGRGQRAAPEEGRALPSLSDYSKLRDRYSSKPELLIKLVDAFRETSAQDLDRIEAALRTADSTALEHAAHRLSGGAGFVCADRVKQLAAELETRAAQHQLDNLTDLSKQLAREVAESLQGLNRFLETVHAEPKVPSSCGKERAS